MDLLEEEKSNDKLLLYGFVIGAWSRDLRVFLWVFIAPRPEAYMRRF